MTRFGDGEPTAKVLLYDAVAVGREFKRGSFVHEYSPDTQTMVANYGCEGWEDARVFLKEAGKLHQFQPWIDGSLPGVFLSPGIEELPGLTRD